MFPTIGFCLWLLFELPPSLFVTTIIITIDIIIINNIVIVNNIVVSIKLKKYVSKYRLLCVCLFVRLLSHRL